MSKLFRVTVFASAILALSSPSHAQGEKTDADLERLVDVFSGVMRRGPLPDSVRGPGGVKQSFREGAAVLAKDGTLLIESSFGILSWGRDGQIKLHRDPKDVAKPKRPGNYRVPLGHGRARKTTKDLPAQAFEALVQGNVAVKLRSNEIGFGGTSYSAKTRPIDIRITQPDRYIDVTLAPNGRLSRPRISNRVPFGFRPAPRRAR